VTGPAPDSPAGPAAEPAGTADLVRERDGLDPAPAGVRPPSGELDPVIHAQARLRVVVALSVLREGDRLTFPRLQELLGMTAGNLSVHLRKLEEAGYLEVVKTHQDRTPTTLLSLTRRGRLAFEEYTAAVQALLNAGVNP
jgi:DNA-binding HxlR family transcriptional regulator